jgi:hypothetical protein
VWSRRLKETLAVITIGDGMIELLAPRQHSLLWASGPASAHKVAHFFADDPNYMRLPGLTQVGFGVWLAFKQYREE